MLPYHPEDLDYEDYVYEEYEDEKDEVTKSYVKVLITNFYIKVEITNFFKNWQTQYFNYLIDMKTTQF